MFIGISQIDLRALLPLQNIVEIWKSNMMSISKKGEGLEKMKFIQPQVGSEIFHRRSKREEINPNFAMPSKRRNNGRSKHGRGHTVSEKAMRCRGFFMVPSCCCHIFFASEKPPCKFNVV